MIIFFEGYHIPFVHPKLNKVLDYKSYTTEIFKNHSLQFAPINSNISPYDKSTGLKNTAYYYTIFPNVLLNIAPGRLQTNVVKPTSPNSCVVDFDYYFDEVSDKVIKNDIKFSNEVQLEDIKICEEVQKRLESRGYNQGRISPQSEKGLYHFQSVLKENLKMAKVFQIGAGLVGKTMAIDLSKDHDLHLADFDVENLKKVKSINPEIKVENLNIKNKFDLKNFIQPADIVLLAVPGYLGFQTLKTILECKKNVVDISFSPENLSQLSDVAIENNVTAIYDAGVAPGLPNYLIGYYNNKINIKILPTMLEDYL